MDGPALASVHRANRPQISAGAGHKHSQQASRLFKDTGRGSMASTIACEWLYFTFSFASPSVIQCSDLSTSRRQDSKLIKFHVNTQRQAIEIKSQPCFLETIDIEGNKQIQFDLVSIVGLSRAANCRCSSGPQVQTDGTNE